MNYITKNTIELCNTLKSEEECSIEISKDNKYIVRIKKGDKLKYIGSKYSVERDVEKFINDINTIEVNETIIIFGLGAGEHIKYLVNSLVSANKIFIVEPNAETLKETLKLNEVEILLEDDRIALCLLDSKIKKYISDFVDDYNISNIKIISFANYSSVFENEYNYFLKQFEQAKMSKKMTTDTFNEFSDEFFNNFMENIFTLANEGFYSINQLKNLYKGKPAVIVSAGPSLTKNVHLLKDVQDKFIIICGPRTIGTLIENDITPDFVCSVDPQDKVYTLMEKYIDFKIPLVFMDSSNSRTVKEQKGSRIIVSNQGMETSLEEILGIKVDSLMQGGSVAHFSMGLATYLGCSTIIFIGQDLAYTNDKFQADGTYAGEMDKIKYDYEKNKEKWDEDKNFSVYVKDIYGNPIRTSVVLKSYIVEFEDLISECNGIKFINSTEGGAYIEGTEVITLKKSIDLYGVKVINKKLKHSLEEIVINEDKFTRKMFDIIDKLGIVKKACKDGIKYSEQMLYFYKYGKYCNLNWVFSELDRVDTIINSREGIEFLAYCMLADIDSVINNEYFKVKESETEKELGIRLSERGLFIYLSVYQTIEDMMIKIRNEFIFDSYENKLKKSLENDNFLFMNEPTEDLILDTQEILIGNVTNANNEVIVYSKKIDSEEYGSYNKSLVLVKDIPINVKKEKYFFIKLEKVSSVSVYFEFVDNEYLSFYKDVAKEKKQFEEYRNSKFEYFNIFFYTNTCECILGIGKDILYRSKKIYFEGEDIDIIIDLKNGAIYFNNNIIIVNKYFVDKYINNKYLLISSCSHNNEDIHYKSKMILLGN